MNLSLVPQIELGNLGTNIFPQKWEGIITKYSYIWQLIISLFGIHFATWTAGDASRGAEFLRGCWTGLKELAEFVHRVEGVVVAAREVLANCL